MNAFVLDPIIESMTMEDAQRVFNARENFTCKDCPLNGKPACGEHSCMDVAITAGIIISNAIKIKAYRECEILKNKVQLLVSLHNEGSNE